jgi:hypothetical protein
MFAWLVFAAVFAAGMADDEWLVFAADAASGAAPLDAMEGREDAAGHEGTPAAAAWTPVKRKAFAARMYAARTKGKFVKHCAQQADSVERLVEHVGRTRRLTSNVDLQIVRADSELQVEDPQAAQQQGRPGVIFLISGHGGAGAWQTAFYHRRGGRLLHIATDGAQSHRGPPTLQNNTNI